MGEQSSSSWMRREGEFDTVTSVSRAGAGEEQLKRSWVAGVGGALWLHWGRWKISRGERAPVLVFVAHGLTNAEIATELDVSLPTVETHVSRVPSKFGARDRARLVVFAYETWGPKRASRRGSARGACRVSSGRMMRIRASRRTTGGRSSGRMSLMLANGQREPKPLGTSPSRSAR